MSATGVNYKKARRAFFLREEGDFVQVTAEAFDTGNGSDVTYSNTVGSPGETRSLESGTIVIGGAGNNETWTDNGDGTLTGSGGGSGTYNTETNVVSLTYAAAPTGAITISYWALRVTGGDFEWMEEVDMSLKIEMIDQNPATGGFHGVNGVPTDSYFEFTGKTIMSTADIAHVSGDAIGVGDTTINASGTLGPNYPTDPTNAPSYEGPGIHNAGAYTTPTGWHPLTITVPSTPTEVFTDASGNGVLVGNQGGAGTINYSTGAWTIAAAAVIPASNITAKYTYLKLPTHDKALRGGGYGRRIAETNTEIRWEYYPAECDHPCFGGRLIRKRTDCLKGLDYRASLMRWTATVQANNRERLMVMCDGFGAARGGLKDCDWPTLALLPDDPALVHTKATLTLKANLADGSQVTFAGQQVTNLEIRNPFEAARLTTATGSFTGGTAEVILNAPDGARAEIDFGAELERPSEFDWYQYLVEGLFYDITWEWDDRQTTPGSSGHKSLRYKCTAYARELATEDDQEVMMVGFRGVLIHGVPGDSNRGRDVSLDLGRFEVVYYK